MLTWGLLPHAILGLAAILAMLLAPRSRPGAVRGVAALGIGLAALAALLRLDAEAMPAPPLFADDGPARFGVLLASLSGLAVLGFGPMPRTSREGPALLCLVALGAAAVASSAHVVSLFVGLEIISLALIGLFVLPLQQRGLEAGYKYLLPGAAGTAALLMGAAFAYAGSGRLDLAAWQQAGVMAGPATALLLVGLGFKLSLVPFHLWAPDVYEGAPPAGAAMAGTAARLAVVIALLRIDAVAPDIPVWAWGLGGLAAVSILFGNLAALRQSSLTRMLGYSSVAHSGYMAAMVLCGASAAPAALLFYVAAYVSAMLAALGVVAGLTAPVTIHSLRGLLWERPLAGSALALAMVSLAGLPVAMGFFAKLFLLEALVVAGAWGLLAAVVVGSGLGLFVYFRFFGAVVAHAGGAQTAAVTAHRPAPWPIASRVVLVASTMVILILGVYPAPLLAVLTAIGG